MVVRQRPRDAWRTRFDEVARPAAASRPARTRMAAVDALDVEADAIDDPHRAIDWLSTFPQVAPRRARRAAVRFQDAAPDARAVVYAGIQAEPARRPGGGPPRRRRDRTSGSWPGP